MYRDMSSCVLLSGSTSRWFKLGQGIRQGSVLSAKLYLVFVNELLDMLMKRRLDTSLLDLRVNCPTQADDIALVSPTIADFQRMLKICECYTVAGVLPFHRQKANS